jgi:DNA-binding SARP family transcriptional activator
MNAITRRIRGGRGGGRHAAAGPAGSVADRGTDPDEAFVTDRLRQLQLLGAEQIRVAAELESAARAQRLAAQELHQGIDALLASWARPTGTASAPAGTADACAWPAAANEAAGLASLPSAPRPAVPEAEVATCVLGPLDLTVAGQRVLRWNSLKARTVFQYLILQMGRPVRREVLMELMWPEHTLVSARNNLNAALYSLRSTLSQHGRDDQYILYQDGCYLPNPGLTWWIDRTEFLAALKDLYLQALECLTEMHIDLNDLAAAVQFGQLALSADQCCEVVHRLLMRCYALQHQQQLVSRQYQLCCTALRDELGVSPGADTVQLFRGLTAAAGDEPPAISLSRAGRRS